TGLLQRGIAVRRVHAECIGEVTHCVVRVPRLDSLIQLLVVECTAERHIDRTRLLDESSGEIVLAVRGGQVRVLHADQVAREVVALLRDQRGTVTARGAANRLPDVTKCIVRERGDGRGRYLVPERIDLAESDAVEESGRLGDLDDAPERVA